MDPKRIEIYWSFVDSQVAGTLENTGHGIVFRVDTDHKHRVNISRGPVVYNYPIYSISIHFGQREDGSGSEHTIDGQNFIAEVGKYFRSLLCYLAIVTLSINFIYKLTKKS